MMKRIILASQSPRRIQLLNMIGIAAEVRPSTIEETVTSTNPQKVVLELSYQKARDVADTVKKDSLVIGADTANDRSLVAGANTARDGFLVIGADTVVAIDGRILGKPRNEEDAFRMLRELSDRTHQVYTGVSLIFRAGSSSRAESCLSEGERELIREECFCEKTEVKGQGERLVSGSLAENGNSLGLADRESWTECFCEKTEVEFADLSDEEIWDYIRTGDPLDKAGSYGIQGTFAKHIRGIRGDYYNVMGLPLSALYQHLKHHHFLEKFQEI